MVSFKIDSASPIEMLCRRDGKPRKEWTRNTLDLIWNHICHNKVDFNSFREQLVQILNAANKEQLESCLYYQVETWISKLNRLSNLHCSYVIQFH